MAQREFQGTNSYDYISTYLWNPAYDYEDTYYRGWWVEALDGDDLVNYHSFGRSYFVDWIRGGKGNDTVYFTETNNSRGTFWFSGNEGLDGLGIMRRDHPYRPDSYNPFTYVPNTSGGDDYILVTYYNQNYDNLRVFCDVEVIQLNVGEGDDGDIGSYYYLTEDIARGIIRPVDTEELLFRTSDTYTDWYYKSLVGINIDSYSDWLAYKYPTPTPEPEPTPAPAPEPTPAPAPEPTPAPAPEPTPAPAPEPTPAPTSEPTSSDPIIGTAGKDKLKAKGRSIEIYGMGGNDKIIGSNGDDILDGGFGNDKIKGRKGADIYILSPGKDKFQGFKIKEGDTIQIDSSFDFEITGSRKSSKIKHDMGVTTIKKVSPTDLETVIEVV